MSSDRLNNVEVGFESPCEENCPGNLVFVSTVQREDIQQCGPEKNELSMD